MSFAKRIETPGEAGWALTGWEHIPDFLDAGKLNDLCREAERLWSDQRLFGTRGAIPNSITRNDRLDPVIDLSPPFAELARDQRLLREVNLRLGGKAQLMKDKFIAKPPGAGGYAAHQDASYWPGMEVDPRRFLTAIFFLDDATPERGLIECAPGLHGRLLTDPETVADPDEDRLGEFIPINARAGDLLLLHALTPHRSGPNRSNEMRRAILLTYGIDERPDLYSVYKSFQQDIRS